MFGKTKRTFGIGLRAVALVAGLATLLGSAHQAVAGSWVPFGGNGEIGYSA